MSSKDSILEFDQSDRLGRTGERIVADRYLQKGGELKVGALAVVILEVEMWGQKTDVYEVARVKEIHKDSKEVVVELADKTLKTVHQSKVDVLVETAPRHMWRRIAKGVTSHFDKKSKQKYEDSFVDGLLSGFKYIPGGRIHASMGTGAKTTSYNCFVIPNVGPTPRDFAKSFGKTLEIQARSGGVGMNLSFVPPQGTVVKETELKRSNVQLVLDVTHPDVYDFVNEDNIKRIRNPFANSTKVIRINDEFENAVANDLEWTFEFPDTTVAEYDTIWNGNLSEWKEKGLPTNKFDTVKAVDLYNLLIEKGVTLTKVVLGAEFISPGDSRGRIAEALAEVWETLIAGKRVAVELSSLRPRLARVVGVNGRSSGAHSWGVLYDRANWAFSQGFGPVSIAEIMSTGCLLILQGGSRRGALMIVLNDWHKDIMKFITAKQNMNLILGANISVGISDSFMEAKNTEGNNWPLGYVKPEKFEQYEKSYGINKVDFVSLEKGSAKEIWAEIMKSAWKSAEPGVIFMERYNYMSNSNYYSDLIATNPCGEQGLPGWGICNLGAINLAQFANGWYDKEYTATVFKNKELEAHIYAELTKLFDEKTAKFLLGIVKWEELEEVTRLGIRFQDAIIDATYYPFKENEDQQKAERRIGLGILGLHDIMLYAGIKYGDDTSDKFCDVLLGMIAEWSYLESVELAKENGPFSKFEAEKYLQSGYMQHMAVNKPHVVEAIKEHGVRNVTLLTIAPTGTTGTMVGSSTGCEPYFAWEYTRNSSLGSFQEKAVIIADYLAAHPEFELASDYSNLPSHFVGAMELSPSAHVRVQASLQKWIDSSISKTCNAPAEYTVEDVTELYEYAYELGCKGTTIYRDSSRDEQILELNNKKEEVQEVQAVEVQEFATTEPVFVKNSRPDVLYGATYKKKTPQGTAYITINDDPELNTAREIFVNVGKAGTDVFAANEALGRMITLYLAESNNPNKEAKIVKHFSSIGGRNAVGFGPNRITSVPDAIAKALIEHSESFPMRNFDERELFIQSLEQNLPPEVEEQEPITEEAPQTKQQPKRFAKEQNLRSYDKTKDECPKCHQVTLVRNGGCSECTACGHSEC